MTPLDLLDALKVFIQEKTKDIILPVRVIKNSGEAKERAAKVYKMRLPDKGAETKQIPYILLQFIKNTDVQQSGKEPESSCMIRVVVATYSENGEDGALSVLNVLTRMRGALLKDGMIADRYLLKPPLEMIVYPDSTQPYYLGEMVTEWQMPTIEREVAKWQ